MDKIKCPCGEAEYCSHYAVWHISVTFNNGFCVDHYPVEYCPHCGKRFNPDGTTGKPYAELEAELAELKRRAAWYLENTGDECAFCINYPLPIEREPCRSCIRIKYDKYDGDKDNFTPAPVPADFEVKENG